MTDRLDIWISVTNALCGKVLRRWRKDEDGHSYYCLLGFVAPVEPRGKLWLMEVLCPEHGEPLGRKMLMRLSEIADQHKDGTDIYDSFEAMVEHDLELVEEHEGEDGEVPEVGVIH